MLNWIIWNRTDYVYKMDLALNNLQRLICHKNPTNQQINQSVFPFFFTCGKQFDAVHVHKVIDFSCNIIIIIINSHEFWDANRSLSHNQKTRFSVSIRQLRL